MADFRLLKFNGEHNARFTALYNSGTLSEKEDGSKKRGVEDRKKEEESRKSVDDPCDEEFADGGRKEVVTQRKKAEGREFEHRNHLQNHDVC